MAYLYGVLERRMKFKILTAIIFVWLAIKLKQPNPLLSLVMIVQNEADNIVETIESVRDVVDYYCILDTGSTDGTQALIQQAFGNTRGHIYQEPFTDFSTTRNRAIELLSKYSTYALMLSGDETIHNASGLRAFLKEKRYQHDLEALNVQVLYGSKRYDSVRLHRTDAPWFYVGKTHEVMRSANGALASNRIPHVHIFHNLSETENKTQRWLLDEQLLLEDWSVQPSSRTAFYLGQTYQCLQNWTHAYTWYSIRWNMKGNWHEEEYEARYRMAQVSTQLNQTWNTTEVILMDAASYRPQRIEPLLDVAYHYYEEKQYQKAYDILQRIMDVPFPSWLQLYNHKNVYEYDRYDLMGTVAYYVNRTADGRRAVRKALEYKPGDARLLENLKYYNE